MRIINFAKRNFKELIRDPLSIVFTIIIPLFLLFIFQQINIPSEAYNVENFTPGIVVFGLTFVTLFTATLIANDRKSSFLIRLGISPMKPYEYVLGYTLSVLPIILLQDILFFALAMILGLSFSLNMIFTILASLIVSILFIMLGILIGSLTSEKGASGLGSMIVQLVVFTSGMYFSTEMMGDFMNTICNILPFKPGLNIVRDVLNGASLDIKDIIIFSIYTVILIIISNIVFKKKMTNDK